MANYGEARDTLIWFKEEYKEHNVQELMNHLSTKYSEMKQKRHQRIEERMNN